MPVLILSGICPICGGCFEYTASSDDYHRYVCKNCGAKLLIPKTKKEEK